MCFAESAVCVCQVVCMCTKRCVCVVERAMCLSSRMALKLLCVKQDGSQVAVAPSSPLFLFLLQCCCCSLIALIAQCCVVPMLVLFSANACAASVHTLVLFT